ncbi:sterol desaturase family protein [Methylomarinum sp. Ch1-1]|uniref:Sterol desaturase family protein n=1 Tax=Methylomarinum roseum TaxID=3067653 RepID=A0AAU7NRS9_9GAMM|nr:sterol desaturase family protein [Methylomarinum sp. Ch1-1]MDP4520339.1 sterol desaturase family protein [Methylomarinum sp. Ch1-1]
MSEQALQNGQEGFLLNEFLLLLAFAAFGLLLIMEVVKPYQPINKRIRQASVVTNSTAFIFNNIILTALRASSLFFVAQQFTQFGLLNGMESGPVKWLLTFLLFDLMMYGWHAATHKYELLWRFHKIHHSDKTVNVTTGFRFHVFDLFIEILIKCLFVIVVGVEAYLVLAIELIEMLFIFFHHSNVAFKHEAEISKVFITPDLHRAHHSALRSEHDSNYGIVLSIWDRIFGTRKDLIPKKLGLDVIEAENFLQLFFLAFVTERHIKKLMQILPKGKP